MRRMREKNNEEDEREELILVSSRMEDRLSADKERVVSQEERGV